MPPRSLSPATASLSVWLVLVGQTLFAGVGDPQVRTDHLWYPGELACSTFERLFETQAEMFERVTGRPLQTDEDRALAAWMWRNLHYAHGEEGKQDLWGKGFEGDDTTTREYWTGLFAHGFGLCGTTHAQWTAELNTLLGPARSRTVGVTGHNACEVFLTGGAYLDGKWVLLDHDVSTVVFKPDGSRLLSIDEVRGDLERLIDPAFEPERQRGWPLGGLHPDDPRAYSQFNVVEHLPGYAGPPPMVSLRRGETLRRYYEPGLEDGKTFVFWGRNYRTGGIPGPERSRTWVNQPENFFGSNSGSGYHPGQARYGNAVYTWRPNFADGSYREGVVAEDDESVVLEFNTPYIIGATPPDDSDWGIYKKGCRGGLVVNRKTAVPLAVSVDHGETWQLGESQSGAADLTDFVKGHRQYWLRLERPANGLTDAELEIVTVCQANPATFPRLSENGSQVHFHSTGRAVVSAGPTRPLAEAHVVEGAFDSPQVTLELNTPRGEHATNLYAAAHVASSNPPDPEISYQIEYSTDSGATWQPVVQDWRILRRGVEPRDFWSQSFCYGDVKLPTGATGPVRVRFRNNGGKRYLRAEAHLAYHVRQYDPCLVTFHWSDDEGERHTAEHLVTGSNVDSWRVETGANVRMHWMEFAPSP